MPSPDAFPIFLVEDSDDDLFLFKRLLAKAEILHPLTLATNGGDDATLVILKPTVTDDAPS